jgi:hypothetical protein
MSPQQSCQCRNPFRKGWILVGISIAWLSSLETNQSSIWYGEARYKSGKLSLSFAQEECSEVTSMDGYSIVVQAKKMGKAGTVG